MPAGTNTCKSSTCNPAIMLVSLYPCPLGSSPAVGLLAPWQSSRRCLPGFSPFAKHASVPGVLPWKPMAKAPRSCSCGWMHSTSKSHLAHHTRMVVPGNHAVCLRCRHNPNTWCRGCPQGGMRVSPQGICHRDSLHLSFGQRCWEQGWKNTISNSSG